MGRWPHGGVRGRAYGRKQCPFFRCGYERRCTRDATADAPLSPGLTSPPFCLSPFDLALPVFCLDSCEEVAYPMMSAGGSEVAESAEGHPGGGGDDIMRGGPR